MLSPANNHPSPAAHHGASCDQAVIVAVDDQQIVLAQKHQQHCRSCELNGACALFGGSGQSEIRLPRSAADKTLQMRPGMTVSLVIEPSSRLWASWWVFAFPALAMIAAALSAEKLGIWPSLGPLAPAVATGIALLGSLGTIFMVDRLSRKNRCLVHVSASEREPPASTEDS